MNQLLGEFAEGCRVWLATGLALEEEAEKLRRSIEFEYTVFRATESPC